ncbi:4828_t:CDS:2 [Cetraspora pellucida]|uniref:4828_t:CDS:1 n=1 Tax=Cetraspora pellucida TaxID=1433469 RepID=A0A9N9EJU3_9GLOM|nr:4828_t:CDS:2 [Cetraspora pellucida]
MVEGIVEDERTEDDASLTNARETMIKLLEGIKRTMSINYCDNNCIITLIISSVVIIILLVGIIWCCVQYLKSGKKLSDHVQSLKSTLTGTGSSSSDTPLLSGRPRPHSIITQPIGSGGEEPILNSPDSLYWSGRNQETTADNYTAAEQFTILNPPREEIPPQDHIIYIQSLGGAKAWDWDPDDSLLGQQIVTIMGEGKVIKFNKRLDSMVQSNYPFFIPQVEGDVVYEAPFGRPETMPHRLGFHSNGKKYNDEFGGHEYSQAWGNVGDTIGCAYNPDAGHVFFTKNGQFLGNAFMGIRHVWFPTVGSNGPCTIMTNFGDPENEFKYESARGYGPGGPLLMSSEQGYQWQTGSNRSSRILQTEDKDNCRNN